MPNKAKPDQSSEDTALEQRVKAIMEPGQPDPKPVAPPAAESSQLPPQPPPQPPIDIFSDPKTAPTVPAKLLEKIGAKPSEPANKKIPAVPAVAAEPDAAATEPAETPATEASSPEPQPTPLDDDATDKAVDEIVVNESDEVLAAEDAAMGKFDTANKAPKAKNKSHSFWANKWLWLSLLVILVAVFAYPLSRDKLVGLVRKEPISVTVTDSKTLTPVSNATISLDGKSAKTDASGRATLHVPPGKATLRITKQYYTAYATAQTIGLRSGGHLSIHLSATGRQVPITVDNLITGKPLGDADISILDTTAKTNKQGQATIVLPTTAVSDSATVSLSGYNTTHVSIQVTSGVISANSVKLTPAGHIYFLSNLSGTIDVVKTNLDGSGRQTVLKGTGQEDPNTTSLLASRDWHYLVLKAQRSSSGPALYLIDTTNDKVTQFDNGNADFTLVGWYGHYFMYDVIRNTVPAWQSGHETLKSYDADTSQLVQLDQNQAEGTSSNYAYQGFYNFYTLNNLVVYNTQWYTYNASGSGYDLTGKSDTITGVEPDGQGKKDYQSIPASGVGDIQAVLFEPQQVYYAVYNYNTNATDYYKFADETVSTLSNLSQTTFNQPYPTYLVSPSGNQTFWTEVRDGQNDMFVGDQNSQTPKQIASLANYAPYGWFTDNYVLVSQNSSQLYIMPASGLAAGQQPLKITDYYKPAQTYANYGYGYGGL
jgi:hypothetical protein